VAGRGDILCADVSAVPDGDAFDVVCAFEVLEHLDDDAGALRAWRERVTEGGWIVLSVPAHQHRFGAHDRAVGHFRRYDPDGLSALLVANGFERPTVMACGFPFGYVLEAVRNLIGRFANLGDTAAERTAASGRRFQPPQAAGALTRALSYPFRVLQRPFAGTPLGTALVAVARRSDAAAAG
jgi:SAM-dependent methyltransferase